MNDDPIDYALCDALILAIVRTIVALSQSQVEEAEALVALLSENASPIEVEMCKVEALARLTMHDSEEDDYGRHPSEYHEEDI